MAGKTFTEGSLEMNKALYGGAFGIAKAGIKGAFKLAGLTAIAAAPESALGRFSARFMNAAKTEAKSDATHTVTPKPERPTKTTENKQTAKNSTMQITKAGAPAGGHAGMGNISKRTAGITATSIPVSKM